MNYLIKSLIQNSISFLPNSISNEIYFFVQRKFGNLKNYCPIDQFKAAIKIKNILLKNHRFIYSSKFLEIGSGRCPTTSICLWLLGASEITTIDINRYFRREIFKEFIKWLKDNKVNFINDYPEISRSKINNLLDIDFTNEDLQILNDLNDLGIKYLAPCDASSLTIENEYFDYHISYNVLEHIKPLDIEKIFLESKRILKKDGLLIHNIDYSDHFSHSDPNISSINFLKFDPWIFNIIAGNQYMYMNRLRDDELLFIFKKLNLKIIFFERNIDNNLKKEIDSDRKKFKLQKKFYKKNSEILANLESWYCLKIN